MIDSVSLHQTMPIKPDLFRRGVWSWRTNKYGETYRYRKMEAVSILYYEGSQRLLVFGKLITLVSDTRVMNLDDLYGANIGSFLDEVNERLNQLFTAPVIDVRRFRVSRIDYCFNVKTPYVKEYISFMNTAFQRIGSGHQINYSLEHDLADSVYVKNRGEYQLNKHDNWTLNFYDKVSWVHKQKAQNRRISDADTLAAKDVLRLEVQLSYRSIKALCDANGMVNEFGNFLDYQTA